MIGQSVDPEPLMTIHAFMLFAAEAPLVGLRDHPAYAPDIPEGHAAEAFMRAYHAFASREEAQKALEEDHADQIRAFAEGDLPDIDDPDFILPVQIHAGGQLDLLSEAGEIMASYSAADVFGAFGLAAARTQDAAPAL